MLLQQHLDFFPMCIQVVIHVMMVNLGLQRIEFSLGVVVIALELGRLYQIVKLRLADLVVCEASLDDALLEILVVGIRQVEVLGRGYRGVL